MSLSMTGLSSKKSRLLDIIIRFTDENGYPPSYSEMSRLSNVSVSTACRICMKLVEAGYLKEEDTAGRKFWPIEPLAG